METKETLLEEALAGLVKNVRGVEGAIVVDRDGFVVASYIRSSREPDELYAIGAVLTAIWSAAERNSEVLEVGEPDRLLIQGKKANVVLIGAGDLVLAAKVDPEAPLGLVLIEAKKVMEQIRQVLLGG